MPKLPPAVHSVKATSTTTCGLTHFNVSMSSAVMRSPRRRRREDLGRYERLEPMSRREAAGVLAQKLAAACTKAPVRSRVTFGVLANEFQATVLPMLKRSTQRHRRYILKKYLLPRFGDRPVLEITRQEIQMYVAQLISDGYAPKSIDHYMDVMSAVLRTAVKWGHIQDNPVRGIDMPALKTVRPKWALTVEQAARLLETLSPLAGTMVGLAVVTGLRRGELFALRWRDVNERGTLTVREAVYDGVFSTPKTASGMRRMPLSSVARALVDRERRLMQRRPPSPRLRRTAYAAGPASRSSRGIILQA